MAQAIILMGVSGSGKTTVGESLSRALGWPFYDADDFHPPANVERMRRGIALMARGANADKVRFVYLRVPAEVAAARISNRRGHFMPASLVPSQFAALEE